MGIILAALAAAGDSGVDSINQNMKQQNALDLATHQSQLEVQKAQTVLDLTNKNADNQREQLADRVGQSDEQNEANTLANAKRSSQYDWVPADTVLNPDGTAPEGTQTIDPTMADLSDEDKQTYKSTPRQILMDQMNNANESGDFDVAHKIAATLQGGKVQTGYGGTTKDSLDIDGETGEERTITDNTTGAQGIRQQDADSKTAMAQARTILAQSTADKNKVLAQSLNSKDNVIVSLGLTYKTAQIEFDKEMAQLALLPSDQQALRAPQMDAARQRMDEAYVRLVERQNGLMKPSGGGGGGGGGVSASKYVVGKTYTDANGNRATYQADGSWK